MILGYSIYELLWLFFIYAFFGWCIEVVFCGLNEGHFINRGFLNGPVCPIYGVGGVIVVLCLTPIKDNLFLLFVGSALLTSILELITGFALDKIFHARWCPVRKRQKPYNMLIVRLLFGNEIGIIFQKKKIIPESVRGTDRFRPCPTVRGSVSAQPERSAPCLLYSRIRS